VLGLTQLVTVSVYFALRGWPELAEAIALGTGITYPFLLAALPLPLSPRRLAQVGYTLAIVATAASAWTTGGVGSPFAPILIVAPTSAFSATGRRGVFALLALSLAALAFLAGSDALALTPAHSLPADRLFLLRALLLGHSILAVALAAFAVELARERAMDKAERARDDAVEAAQARARFLAAISHEIRTPLNGLLGMAQLLRDTPLDPEQRRMAATLERSGTTLLALVNQLLDYARIEARGVQLELVSFDVRELVEDVLEVFSAQASEKGLDLVYRVDPLAPPRAFADVARLRQILANLVGNGVKYTPEGWVEVRVSAPTEGSLSLQVEDTGPGISAEEAAVIFEPFRRGTGERSGGTGLGLTVSRQLAEAMGGQLTMTDGEAGGACFEVRVAVEAESDEVTHTHLETRLAMRKVQLIEERPHVRAMLESMLDSMGAQVVDESPQVVVRGQGTGDAPDDVPVVGLRGLTPAEHRADATVTEPVRRAALSGALLQALGIGKSKESPIWQQDAGLAERAPLRLLVAEDNVVNQQVVRLMLERLGYRCDLASDGAEAVERARAGYDVILMDVQMPVLDGVEATRRIVKQPGAPDVIGVSASVTADARAECEDAGMVDFVGKPLRMPDLAAALVRAAERRGALVDTDAQSLIERLESDRPTESPRARSAREAVEKLALVAGDPERVRAMVGTFLQNAQQLVEEAQAADGEGDEEAVRRVAHKLKGTSATYGAFETGERAAAIEDGGSVAQLAEAFALDRDAVRAALEAL